MKSSILLLALVIFAFCSNVKAQSLPFSISIEALEIPGMPELQSYVWASYEGKWLLIGGRTDGLHQRQPFAAFLAADNNTNMYIIDPQTFEIWQSSVVDLPTNLEEQLQSTNMNFSQVGDKLFVIGGYGYSNSAADHITFPFLTVIDVPQLMVAIINGTSTDAAFLQYENEIYANTGGQLNYLENRFYLCGGQYFEGRYNPMGPDHGAGFIQNYSNAIHSFVLEEVNSEWQMSDLITWTDVDVLHRRDYNMLPQVLEDGTAGLIMFSGVFQEGANLPWHSIVRVQESGYSQVPAFEQLLNQYHSAHAPLYSELENEQYNLFFAGISRYYYDEQNNLIDDTEVPFVNTISAVMRDNEGNYSEMKIGEMPDLLGSGAEFILNPELAVSSNEVIQYDQLGEEQILLGYIVGGIKSSAPNIFFLNDGTQSSANTIIYKVFINPGSTGINDQLVTDLPPFRPVLFPNPIIDTATLTFHLPVSGTISIELFNIEGKLLFQLYKGFQSAGDHAFEIDPGNIPSGNYMIKLSSAAGESTLRFIKK